jgi:ketosteroid isomerase-like protein
VCYAATSGDLLNPGPEGKYKMDLDAERTRLLRRDAEWATAASEGRDVERILSFWTDDAVVYAPGLPAIVGKDALRQYVRDSLQIPGFQISWMSKDATLSPDGNLAYMFSRNAVTLNLPDGTPTTTEGRAVTIWRRESGGEWRCAVDIWNS